jgi:lipoate-protein ligase A
MREEIDLAACERLGVEAVRRVTGGGAVFHQAELTYSLVVREGHELAPADILESYRLICAGLIAGIGNLGVEASFAPINDIVTGGKKVSGNAQTRRRGCLLQHGTLLLDVDVETMFELLLVPQEKLKGKLIADVKQRVVGMKTLLGRELGFAEAAEAMTRGFASAWSAELEAGEARRAELERASVLAAERYRTEAWKFKR